jgi:hypothetical protein
MDFRDPWVRAPVIKHYRRVATRYEKTVSSFATVLFSVAAMIWLK